MILYYAMGGGLGHLTRARAVVHTLGIREPVSLVTASSFASDPRVIGSFDLIRVPSEFESDIASYRRWLRELIDVLMPSQIYLDTFPAGIAGEFSELSLPRRVTMHCIGRLLRWDQYEKTMSGEPTTFDTSYILEPLRSEHQRHLENHSDAIVNLALEDPPESPSQAAESALREPTVSRRRWFVVHSGPEKEVRELMEYAQGLSCAEGVEPELFLISPGAPADLPMDVRHLNVYPASRLFAYADRVITGCGFNVMRQTESIAHRHSFLPFPRRFDDQYLRAARRREALRAEGTA